jgi:hypothetical protein
MLRHFAAVSRALGALLLAGVLLGCGIKGPLRPPPATPAATTPQPPPPTNPEARPPLLPSEPPSAIVPPEPAKKP